MTIAVTAAVVFVLDALTKWLVVTRLPPGHSVAVVPGFFYLTDVRNAGAAFGLLQGQTLLFILVALAVIVAIVVYGRRVARGSRTLATSLGLLLGGALGNLLDRVLYGRVIDFLDFRVWAYVFNVADSAIVIGAVLFAVHSLRTAAAEER